MTRFLFAACQPGFEAALKQEVARRHPALRFAFSRPGFVTFRVADEADDSAATLRCAFARTWGHSLGKVVGTDPTALARDAWALAVRSGDRGASPFLHVWQRERALPGDEGYDPAAPTLADAAGAELLAQRPGSAPAPALNAEAPPGASVLDCVLVEPHEWWIGWHRAASPETRWPGGVPLIGAPPDMISRAYLKLEEALRWSELPVEAGDRCVEIGSAPGGSCAALLARGCIVTGIDPAEMDPTVLANPRFTHVRARAREVPRATFRGARWLMSDTNVAPKHTLDTVEAILGARDVRIEGLVLTLKLTDPRLTAQLPAFHKRIRGWGYRHVRARQLAFNRQEVCVVATEHAGTT
ncbi:MAG TPA: SAM-dependent methyltransferase [Gammaproteobacteria bacterium]|nr:SAM-dependent methyltransferase [Gammaproteobacteria bacterium]